MSVRRNEGSNAGNEKKVQVICDHGLRSSGFAVLLGSWLLYHSRFA
jgi:hypothetical protein